MALAGIREASRLIFVDELTGLYNRRFMRQYLRDRLALLGQQGTPLAVIMLDVDGFKQINDTCGHLDGDRFLKSLAQQIRDALPQGGYAIRFAGDEFFVFLEGVDGAGGMRVAEQIRERVSHEPFVSDKAPAPIPLTASLGVAAYPDDASSPSELVEAADQALYRSKRDGKNRVSRAGEARQPAEVEILKRFPCPRLVAREAELAELEGALGEAGGSRLLLVEASRGLGKSRLLLELMRRAGSAGRRWFFARCLAAEHALPYSALRTVLAACLEREPERLELVRSRLGAASLGELATLLPMLAPPGGRRETLVPEERRSLLFHGVTDLLGLLSTDSPLVLFLDDLQYVDEASLEVLCRLIARADGRVLVFAAVQTEALERETSPRLPLARLGALLRLAPNFQRVTLSTLSAEQVARMVTEILQRHTPSPAFLQQLHEASQGIPLFVEETLKALINEGALRTVEGTWDLEAVEPAMAASLEEVIRGRLEALDQELHQMIAKAAVVGPHVDLELLAGVLGKDPGETQHLVDRGKKQRVFEEMGVMSDEDEVHFLSQCFQQIVYEGLEPGDRRRTHRTVGEVTERLAGDRADEVLGSLAFHFERSDDPVKAELYRQRAQERSVQLFSAAEIAEELSLKVDAADAGGPPLDAGTWPLADRVLRGIAIAVKNIRVYPAGSRLVDEGVAAVGAALLDLLGRVETLTLGEDSKTLQVNGQPIEQKGLLPAAHDLLRVFADHGIRRCTFERGLGQDDVRKLLRILSSPGQTGQQDVTAWDRRLQAEGIGHVRVFPVIYLASGAGATTWRREHGEALLDDATQLLARDVLRSLAAVVDNVRLYPAESQIIAQTLDQLERHAETMLGRLPSLTVASADGTIVVNAIRPNPRLFGLTIEVLQSLMDDSGLTSLTIRRGVTREQFRTFLTHLAQPVEEAGRDPGFWQRLLDGDGITTIEVGTRAYAAASRLAAEDIPGAEAPDAGPPPETESAPTSEAEQTLAQVSRWLALSLAGFLERSVQEQIPPVLPVLLGMGREELAAQLVERTASGLREGDGALRTRAAVGLGIALARVDAEATAWVLDKCARPVAEAASREGHLEAFHAETGLATSVLGHLLRAGDLEGAARVSAALGGAIPNAPDLARFTEAVRSVVDNLGTTQSLEPVLARLTDADPARRARGKAVLAGFGAGAQAYLAGLAHDAPDDALARAAAEVLASQGEAGARVLTHGLDQEPSAARVRRVVSLLDALVPTLGANLVFLVGHRDRAVRAELGRTLTRVPREHALKLVGQALAQRRPEMLLGALELTSALNAVELLNGVIRVVESPPSKAVLPAACQTLGRLRDPRALPALVGIVDRRPRLLGIVKGLPQAARVAAVRALGELGAPEARAALQRAMKDRAKDVRAAARFALLKLQRESGAKPSA